MVRPYEGDARSLADLETWFPDRRPPPPPRTFEFSIAAAGGVSTGAYMAGVMDFMTEALDEFSRAQVESPDATPTHRVRLVNLAGASAGGATVALAAASLLKDAPHVYHEAKWASLVQAGLADGEQQADLNPLYRAWVREADARRLLAAPTAAETEIALFAPAGAISEIVLGMLQDRPDRPWPTWAPDALDLRVLVGNLRGVPYALTFENDADPRAGERLTLHRDNVAFSVSAAGPDGAPDSYALAGADFNSGPAWALLRSAAAASTAIPGVFAPVRVEGVDPAAYQWRDCFFDTGLGLPILDQPFWESPPQTYAFTASDGGLFDNEPFDVAHRMLSGAEARNRREGVAAERAVVLVAAVVNDQAGDPDDPLLQPAPGSTPLSRLLKAAVRIVYAPIQQSRWDAFDLALIKSEAVFSRFMIAPRRESPNPADHGRLLGPSKSLMSLPLHLFLGFAAEAYRRHDFLLGRRNAQRFLAEHFLLPSDNPIIDPADPWELGDVRLVQDPTTGAPTVFYPIVPLRGAVRQSLEEPLPQWDWLALTDERIAEIKSGFGIRADAVRSRIEASLAIVWRLVIELLWLLGLRSALVNAFGAALAAARAELDPSNY